MNGIGVSPGIAIGKAYVLKKSKNLFSGIRIKDQEIEAEINRLYDAVEKSKAEVESLKSALPVEQEEADILNSHIGFLEDKAIIGQIIEKIREQKCTAEDAVIKVITELKQKFLELEDEYFRARATDIEDIGDRIVSNLSGRQKQDISKLDVDVIIIAEDLTPSDTISMDRDHVIAFATVYGSRTSHTSIIANMREIPAVVACGEDLNGIKEGDTVIVDGSKGVVIVNPDAHTLNEYRAKQKDLRNKLHAMESLRALPAETEDGYRVKLLGNISSPSEIQKVFESGGEGIGLFRTEFLYMGRTSFPSEDEQYEFYKAAAISSGSRPVIIRTLDIGGDKQLCYFNMFPEANPFLGYRAIRICLDRKDIFKTQLRAILRASKYGKLKIMFPMISGINELREAKSVVEEVKSELESRNDEFDKNIEIGVMIEIPSAALTADIIAKEADFFSIGTNDLCQYTMAADRMNEKVAGICNPFTPAVLRLIKNVISRAHENYIPVGMCGEMASDPMSVLLLLGLGLDEFSMNPNSIPHIKHIIRKSSIKEARKIARDVMKMETPEQIIDYLRGISDRH